MFQVGKISQAFFPLHCFVNPAELQDQVHQGLHYRGQAFEFFPLLLQGTLEIVFYQPGKIILAGIAQSGDLVFQAGIIAVAAAAFQAAESRGLDSTGQFVPAAPGGLPGLADHCQVIFQVFHIRLRAAGITGQFQGPFQAPDHPGQLLPHLLQQYFFPGRSKAAPGFQGGKHLHLLLQPGRRAGVAAGKVIEPQHQVLQSPVPAVGAEQVHQPVKIASRVVFPVALFQESFQGLIAQQGGLIFIHDAECRIHGAQVGIAPDHIHAEGVNGADLGPVQQQQLTAKMGLTGPTGEDLFQPCGNAVFHLRRCSVGKGDNQKTVDVHPAVFQPLAFPGDALQDALHQHPGFAGAGPGGHQEIPAACVNRPSLGPGPGSWRSCCYAIPVLLPIRGSFNPLFPVFSVYSVFFGVFPHAHSPFRPELSGRYVGRSSWRICACYEL